jgi:hypothetical protein
MIHPVFESIPDHEMAHACSEILVPGQYTFAQRPDLIERYGNSAFPQVPAAEFVAISAAYYEGDANRHGLNERQQFTTLVPNPPSGEAMAKEYTKTIDYFRDPKLQPSTEEYFEFWADEQIRLSRKRLIAAHVIARSISDGSLIDAFVYPKQIMTDFPFVTREVAVDVMAHVKTTNSPQEFGYETLEDLKEALRPFLQADEEIRKIGAGIMSLHLPDPEVFASIWK